MSQVNSATSTDDLFSRLEQLMQLQNGSNEKAMELTRAAMEEYQQRQASNDLMMLATDDLNKATTDAFTLAINDAEHIVKTRLADAERRMGVPEDGLSMPSWDSGDAIAAETKISDRYGDSGLGAYVSPVQEAQNHYLLLKEVADQLKAGKNVAELAPIQGHNVVTYLQNHGINPNNLEAIQAALLQAEQVYNGLVKMQGETPDVDQFLEDMKEMGETYQAASEQFAEAAERYGEVQAAADCALNLVPKLSSLKGEALWNKLAERMGKALPGQGQQMFSLLKQYITISEHDDAASIQSKIKEAVQMARGEYDDALQLFVEQTSHSGHFGASSVPAQSDAFSEDDMMAEASALLA